jgi:D-glycero-D-manno-heptose 1,7-bisphosphate phosphatase
MSGLRPAVFLDRDGTLMEDTDYPRRPEDVRLYPAARTALERLRAAGYLLVVITNQSGIGRGYFTVAEYEAVHAEFVRQLAPARIDAAYYAPEAPGTPSERRKPRPGMVLEAALEWGVDLQRSFLVGDKRDDVECARNAGVRAVQVLTGKGAAQRDERAEHVAEEIGAAAEWILRTARDR